MMTTNTQARLRIALLLLSVAIASLNGPGIPRVSAAGSSSYQLVNGWPSVPASVPMGFISWMAADDTGRTYVFRRCPMKCADGPHPGPSDPPGSMLLFDKAGKYLGEWEPKSGGKAKEAHGLSIDRNGFIWTTDVQLHVVKKYAADGTLLMTLGKVGVPGETPETFNKPTSVFVASDGSAFVTDGYGNQRVVKLDKNGKFVKAWGKKGTGPGEFRLPHAVTQDRNNRIYIADRCGLGETKCTDGRLQVFDTEGRYLTEWKPPGGAFAPFALSVDTSNRLYVDDTQNGKVWILDAQTMKVIDSVDAAGHGMFVNASGSEIYIAGGASGLRLYRRSS